ncbi:MAG: asparagine synthase (glutamine-hydrolyzing) [Bacteroidetes bacterium]|nr:asparagine synthase (glutamine-hydrolyzing) [Bacteroidota bacterium]
MCGIAGWVGQLENPLNTTNKVIDRLKHRGPDFQDSRHFGQVSLIHCRLSIIDTSSSANQPMSNEDDSLWMVFNGEIYNFPQLRQELLAKGHLFKSNSDSEVIIHLYEELGEEFVSRLEGMFAFALYDRKKSQIILARDRFGIKPLFYYHDTSFFAYSSEMGTFKCIPGLDLEIDQQAVSDYISFLYIHAPQTLYNKVRMLMPGECLVFDQNSFKTSSRMFYKHRQAENLILDYESSAEELIHKAQTLLESSVKRQMRSDVALGTLLSGGIDSSLVSVFAQKEYGINPIHTFNAKFPDNEYDETWAALEVSKQIGSMHRTLEVSLSGGTWENITGILNHIGQPFADTSIFAVNEIMTLIKKHVTVALAGDGGDECFGGYAHFERIPNVIKFIDQPMWLRNLELKGLKAASKLNNKLYPLYRGMKNFTYVDEVGALEAFYTWNRQKEKRELWVGDKNIQETRRFFEDNWRATAHIPEKLERFQMACTLSDMDVLMQPFLFKVDTASMMHSIEVRVPFLDEKISKFGLSLPYNRKVNRENKFLLRAIARNQLPEKVANKPKGGFSIPVDVWANDDFKALAREQLLKPDSNLSYLLNKSIYKEWVDAFVENRQTPGISREGLYQRFIMLLSLSLYIDK